MRLVPNWPPNTGFRLARSAGKTISDYDEVARCVFLKTLDCPISIRRYSVGKGFDYLYLRNCFCLTHASSQPGVDVPFRPGGEISIEEQDEDYVEKRKRRSQKVFDYISSPDCDPTLVRVLSTCQARWAFDRNINPKSGDGNNKIDGMFLDLSMILRDYRQVISGEDVCANFIIGRLPSSNVGRLEFSAAMLLGVLYLAEKN